MKSILIFDSQNPFIKAPCLLSIDIEVPVMNYIDSYNKLRKVFSSVDSETFYKDYSIHRLRFQSRYYDLLPGNDKYRCGHHNKDFGHVFNYYNDVGTIQDDVHQEDFLVEENRDFSYYILKPKSSNPIKKVTFLFHGFNEKNWDKYFTWGQAICERTQSAVVFFPIAFHMQRAPGHWSNPRKMYQLCEKRKKRFPNIIKSTLFNVAISMRLQSMPQRFIWSGLQTYYDVIQFVEECKKGENSLIDKNATFDIFAFSIGGLLAEILKLSNYRNYFSDSKVCLFCSGTVFNRLSPVSKFILDSEASVALYSYLVEHFDSFLNRDAHLRHYIKEGHFEGKIFHSMLEYKKMRDFREEQFKKIEDHVYAIPLKQDTVIPSFEVINTLQGAFRNINIPVDEMDFNYRYIHENPFPVNHKEPQKINSAFNRVFDKAGSFFES